MKRYEAILTGNYEKTITIYANSPEQAAEKLHMVLLETDLIDFADEDLISGKAVIQDNEPQDDGQEEPYICEEACPDCVFVCPTCGGCLCENEV